jgi:hypothetical protein
VQGVQTDLVLPLVVAAAEQLGDMFVAFHLEPYVVSHAPVDAPFVHHPFLFNDVHFCCAAFCVFTLVALAC